MGISHWASPKRRAACMAAYNASLELWPIPFEHRQVSTEFGSVHAVVSGNPTGDPIVLLHAASLTATQWYPQASSLGATYRLYALDILGDIGLSSATTEIRRREDAAAWLVAALDALGLERPIFVGSSFGGFYSTTLAVLRPERVRALVLLAPSATIRPFKLLANLAIRSGSLLPMPGTVKPGLRGMTQGELPDARIVRQMEVGVAGFRYDRRGLYPGEIPDRELAAIRCPTLLLVGSKEMIYQPDAAISRARKLIPNVETGVGPGLGHLLGLQRPELVDPPVIDFLTRILTQH